MEGQLQLQKQKSTENAKSTAKDDLTGLDHVWVRLRHKKTTKDGVEGVQQYRN